MTLRARTLLALATAVLTTASAVASDAPYLPGTASAPAVPIHADPGMGPVTVVGALLLACAGGWLLLRGRKISLPGRTARKLAIDETRSLGSRQYLVVASYEGRKLLLGVCPGRIDLLTPLDGSTTPSKAP
jgi:flagellar protein FliO/FliZ